MQIKTPGQKKKAIEIDLFKSTLYQLLATISIQNKLL